MCVHEVKSSHRNPDTSEVHELSSMSAFLGPTLPSLQTGASSAPKAEGPAAGPGAGGARGDSLLSGTSQALIDSRRGSPEAALPPPPHPEDRPRTPLGSLGPNRGRRKGVRREARRQRRRKRPRGAARSELGGGDPPCTHLREAKRDSPGFRFSSLRS